MNKNNGGPAFPKLERERTEVGYRYSTIGGMTLRDYFAAKAMNALICMDSKSFDEYEVAETAYEVADAMLKARGES